MQQCSQGLDHTHAAVRPQIAATVGRADGSLVREVSVPRLGPDVTASSSPRFYGRDGSMDRWMNGRLDG